MMKKTKILHIQVLPKMAGVQWVSYDILKSLSNDEYEKHILFSSDMDENNKSYCKTLFESIDCKVIFLDSLKRAICLKDIKAIKDIYKLCKKEKYDIVHTNSTKPGVVGRIGARLAKTPYIIHTIHGLAFHNYVEFPKWQFYWFCEMFSSIFCNRIAIVNKYYSKYFNWTKNKIVTIYNGVEYPPRTSIEKLKNDDRIRLLFVGRLSQQKDPLTMIKAFSLACDKKNELELTIVGDGELYDECKRLVRSLGKDTYVKFEGWQNEVSKYYKTHDIFITTSIYEAFGLVFLDAGYHKLPTIATNVEGIPEVIKDGVTGMLSNPKDVKTISDNILRLANDVKLRREMGEKAYTYVTRKFTVNNMTEAYKQLYKESLVLSDQ